jgi:hypothetical protein
LGAGFFVPIEPSLEDSSVAMDREVKAQTYLLKAPFQKAIEDAEKNPAPRTNSSLNAGRMVIPGGSAPNEEEVKEVNSGANFYIQFWNSALSFLTMGTMLITSTIIATDYVQKNYSEQYRITRGLMMVMVFLIINIVLIFLDLPVGMFFAATLVIVVSINLFSGFYQTTVFQFCACFPPNLYNSMLQGQAVGGIFANGCAILCSVVFPLLFNACQDAVVMNNMMATVFFLIAFGVVFLTYSSYNKMITLPIYKHYSSSSPETDSEASEETKQPLTGGEAQTLKKSEPSVVLSQAKYHLLAVYVTFTVTLAIFPTLVAEVKNHTTAKDKCGLNTFDPLFFKFSVLLMFNVGDFIGRKVSNTFKGGLTAKNSGPRVLFFSFCRILFYWVFFACNVDGNRQNNILSKNYVFITCMLLFGITNGWVGGLAMEFAPTQVTNDADKVDVGSYTIIVLTMGLLSGAGLSFGVKQQLSIVQDKTVQKALMDNLPSIVSGCINKCSGV